MKYKILFMVCILSCIFTMTGCFDQDKIESFHGTLADAQKSGAIERGWVPGFLPEATVNIKEVHDLDTNEVWIRFEIKNASDAGFLRNDMKVSLESIKGNLPKDPGVKWWPKLLLNNTDRDLSRYSFFRTSEIVIGSEKDSYFARENGTDYVYFWSQ